MKIYCNEVVSPGTEDSERLFAFLMKLCDDEERNLISLHDDIRKLLNLPNKIFAFAKSEGNTRIILFDKEPDDKRYKVCTDSGHPYIETDDENKNESE